MTSGKFQSSAPSFSRSVVMSCKDWCEGSGWHFTLWINESNQLLWMTLFNCFQGKYFDNILLYSFFFFCHKKRSRHLTQTWPQYKEVKQMFGFWWIFQSHSYEWEFCDVSERWGLSTPPSTCLTRDQVRVYSRRSGSSLKGAYLSTVTLATPP